MGLARLGCRPPPATAAGGQALARDRRHRTGSAAGIGALRTLGEAAPAAHPTVPALRRVDYGNDAEQRRTDATALPWRDVAWILAAGGA